MVQSTLKLVVATCLIVCASCSSRSCITTDIDPCVCSYLQTETGNKTMVICSGHGLESVPSNLPADTAILDFSDNMLGYGDLSSLCEYAQLENVSIANNHITDIGEDNLRRCEISKCIDFTRNTLESVTNKTLNGLQFTQSLHGLEANHFTENAFSDLLMLTELEMTSHQKKLSSEIFRVTKIKNLHLSMPNAVTIPETLLYTLDMTLSKFNLVSSSIQILPEKIFHNLTKLQDINLHLGYLRSIPADLFQAKTLTNSLQSISLFEIKNITSGLFTSLGYLHHLTIHGTSSFPDDLFSGLFSLESVELRFLELDMIPKGWFKDLRSLLRLQIKECDLTVISQKDIEYLGSLEILDVSMNKIRDLEPGLFYDIGDTLLSLNMSSNFLKEIPNGLFVRKTALQTLDLSENQISDIRPGAFEMLTELKWLYLQNNKISILEANTFALNTKMFYLELSSNILIDLPSELFKNTSSLSILKLSNNKFINLKKSIYFDMYSSLSELNVNYNPIVCDCDTVEFVNILNTVNISGECNNRNYTKISIVEFMVNNTCGVDSSVLETTSPTLITEVPYTWKNDESDEKNISPESVSNLFTEVSDLVTLNASISGYDSIKDTRVTSLAHELPTLNDKELDLDNNDVTDTDLSALSSDYSPFDMSSDQILTDMVTESEINSTSVHMIPSLNRVTAKPHNASDDDGDYFIISLVSILSVAAFSFLILAYLYYKKRRSRRYEVARSSHFEVGGSSYSFGKYFEDDYRNDSMRSLSPLREVPSIQIESVDDDGNIRVELYSDNKSDRSDGTSV